MRKFQRSFSYALEGLHLAAKTQRNFRIQIVIGLFSILIALLLGFNRFEWIILLISICLVLSAELTNTVFELIVDLIMPTHHEKAKFAKDISAGTVLLICSFAIIIGLLLFFPHFLIFF